MTDQTWAVLVAVDVNADRARVDTVARALGMTHGQVRRALKQLYSDQLVFPYERDECNWMLWEVTQRGHDLVESIRRRQRAEIFDLTVSNAKVEEDS